jgi:5'-3' exonuclease
LLRDWVEKVYDTHVLPDLEADDVLGLNMDDASVIASIDKDLLQIPGKHYNWKLDSFFDVTPIEGLRSFYQQVLSGDPADNIKGCKGIGPKKAKEIIGELEDADWMWKSVCFQYYLRGMTADDALLNARLCYILHPGDDPANPIWNPPCPAPDPLPKFKGAKEP